MRCDATRDDAVLCDERGIVKFDETWCDAQYGMKKRHNMT